ncbi:MAG: ketopantoate reductase family protein [Pseudomonadota bacterium]
MRSNIAVNTPAPTERTPVLILGAGAIGCLWSRALQQNNVRYDVIVKPAYARSDNTARIHFRSLIDPTLTLDYTLSAIVANSAQSAYNFVFVTTKANDALAALASIQHLIDPKTSIVLFQNGMGIQQSICEQYPNNDIACAVTTEGAFCTEPFHVVHSGKGVTQFGLIQTPMRQGLGSLLELLNDSYMSHCETDNIMERLWRKLCINAAINAYTVIYNCKNGELLQHADAMQRIAQCCDELTQLTAALKFEAFDALKAVYTVLENTYENHSSMHQDVNKQRLTEIEFINGYVVRLAQKHTLACLENKAAYDAIKAIEAQFDSA